MSARPLQITTHFEPEADAVSPGQELTQHVRVRNPYPVEYGVRLTARLIDAATHQDCATQVAAYSGPNGPTASVEIIKLLRKRPKRMLGKEDQDAGHIASEPLQVIVGTPPNLQGPSFAVQTTVSGQYTQARNGVFSERSSWASAGPDAGGLFSIRAQ